MQTSNKARAIGRRGRITAMLAVAAAAAVLAPSDALASGGSHTQSFTDNWHGSQTVSEVNPCTGDTIDLSEDTNMVQHVTYFPPPSDEAWGTFTEEDRFSGIDEATGVTYTGHDTFWGNFNLNRQNSNSTFTATIRATGSDGSTLAYHEVAHFTMLPDGNVSVNFDRPTLTCG